MDENNSTEEFYMEECQVSMLEDDTAEDMGPQPRRGKLCGISCGGGKICGFACL